MMNPAATDLQQAIAAFRREQAHAYLERLAGREPVEAERGAALLCSERAREALLALQSAGGLSSEEYAASCAHMVRAIAERAYAPARKLERLLPLREVDVEGDVRSAEQLFRRWLAESNPDARERLEGALDALLLAHARSLSERVSAAGLAVSEWLSALPVPRWTDAGKPDGAAADAEAWLAESEDLAREAFAHAAKGGGAAGGLRGLWWAAGLGLSNSFEAEGRFRRLGEDAAAWDLRRLLSAHVRLRGEHSLLRPSPHVIVTEAPRRVGVVPSRLARGLMAELTAADAVGRATAHAHASPALAPAVRHATVASSARGFGALWALRYAEPAFLTRFRGVSRGEATQLARAACAFFLVESRLLAAAVLSRALPQGADAEDARRALAERALLGPVRPGAAGYLLVRLAPGGPFRAKSLAPGLVWALRERYDTDWFRNPHAGAQVRGWLLRAGSSSVEELAAELSAEVAPGIGKLAELF